MALEGGEEKIKGSREEMREGDEGRRKAGGGRKEGGEEGRGIRRSPFHQLITVYCFQ